MWPWGHLAVAYLAYSLSSRLWLGRPPSGAAAVVVAFASQLPDLVDKPLAWTLGVLPSGRSLAHSLLVAVPVVALAWLVARRRGRRDLAAAFGVGYLSHLAADALVPLYYGNYAYLSYLGWPVLPPPPYGEEAGFVGHFVALELTPFVLAQAAAAVVVVGVWWLDRRPGLGVVLAALGWRSTARR